MSKDTGSDRWLVFFSALLFWLLIPFPFWLIGVGFAGELVLWPSFEPDVFLFSLIFVAAFYGPLLLMGMVLWDVITEARTGPGEKTSNNAQD